MPLEINNKDKFCIAVCMESHLHTFLIAGTIQQSKFIPLVDVGKHIPIPERGQRTTCNIFLRMLTGYLHSAISNEKLLVDNTNEKEREVSYIAFDISYDDYLRFLQYLKFINPDIKAYIPTNESKSSGDILLEYQPLTTMQSDEKIQNTNLKDIYDRKDYLSFVNSCRSAAIELLKLVLPKEIAVTSIVPINFMYGFPFLTSFKSGELSSHLLFTLPAPPPKDSPVLTNAYNQLQACLFTSQWNESTRKNFIALKDFYDDLLIKRTNPKPESQFIQLSHSEEDEDIESSQVTQRLNRQR